MCSILSFVSAPLNRSQCAPSEKITGDEAARLICSSSQHHKADVLGFDSVDATRLGLKRGEVVSVTPSDNGRLHASLSDGSGTKLNSIHSGKIPTVGKLVALTREESVIETRGSAGTVQCHFPRLEFVVKPESPAAAKL